MSLSHKTIKELGELYRKREVSPVDVTKDLLANIDRYDPTLNSYATVLADRAMEQAREFEQAFMTGVDRGALQGIPINLKDNILTSGVPTELGSPIMKGYVPDTSAHVARQLGDAGTILLGKTNMLEFAYGEPHPDIGITNNPWNVGHTVSGSSSGSAASVAAGLAFGTLGTDTGGSIRLPSCYCGLVGLKPTYGLASIHGIVPLAWSLDHVGPMTRSVYDNALMLHAISKYQFEESQITAGVKELKIAVLKLGAEVDAEVQGAIFTVTDHLEKSGAQIVRDFELPVLDEVADILMGIMLPEASSAHDELVHAHGSLYHPLIRDRLEIGSTVLAVDYLRVQRYRNNFCRKVYEALSSFDALILPTAAAPAPPHDAIPDLEVITRFTGPFNVTGLPALALPSGMSGSGLPLGMQIVGKPFTESVLYQIAMICEEVTGCRGQVADSFK